MPLSSSRTGCIDIAGEVGQAKIGDPYDLYVSGKTNEALYAVESWYSWHSRDDYTNNIYSIRNAYYGSLDKIVNKNSLSALVAKYNAELDAEVKAAITNAANAIQAIPQPFRNNINSKEAQAAIPDQPHQVKLVLPMNKYVNFLLLLTGIFGLVACDDSDQLDVEDINIPRGYALSAGTSTGFYNSSVAYDQAAAWLSGTYASRFNVGDRLYDNVKTSNENGHGGGLGPVYAGYSCGSCHRNAGRTEPTYWTSFKQGGDDGSGPYGFTASLIYITRKNGTFFPNYGRVIHDQAIYGVHPEGKLKVKIDSMTYSFPDGEKYTLCVPRWSITEWYADSISPDDLFCTVRVPLRHVGMGQMMALDPDEIEALARKSNYPEWGISGRCNYINERGKLQLGLSGNKAQHADLTVELGFSSDMGMTNSRYPEEICEGQLQMEEGSMMGLCYEYLDVSSEDMENVDLYMQGLAVPARRNVNNDDVKAGEQLFYQAGCHLCHVTTLHTKPRGSTLLMGTNLPWLGGQTIHPYSDYLLHDMGSEIMGVGLNDNFVSGLARGNEWRTTPLWGIGLQKKVNGHTYFLHDGRARNFVEAIMWHGGEGEASKNKFKNMSKKERDQLVQFLWSL